jgi:uncharacterized protein (TIGR02246 family)
MIKALPLSRAAAFVLGIAVAGCTAHVHPSGPALEDQLRQAMQQYSKLLVAMDSGAIAALFTPDGEIVVTGQEPVRGRDAIRKHLESFKDFQVQSDAVTTDTVAVHGEDGHVTGSFRQRVRVPGGEVVEAHGTYTSDWLHGPDGKWYIRSMSTTPQP